MIKMLTGLFKQDHDVLNELVRALSFGKRTELNNFLWRPRNKDVRFLAITYGLLKKYEAPADSGSLLQIYRTHTAGDFSLIIFRKPWDKGKFPYEPLLLNHEENKVAGIMLPFNEIIPLLRNSEHDDASELAKTWALWAFQHNSGL